MVAEASHPRVFASLIREQPHYRRDAFVAGMRACGLKHGEVQPAPGAVLLIWNRYGHYHEIATRYERAGGIVLVAENGMLGRDREGGPWYSLARSWPNAPVPVGGPERGLPAPTWRKGGEAVLLLPQRGFTAGEAGQPAGWVERARARLAAMTKRPVVVRPHPGNDPQHDSLMRQLESAWCTVTWASGAAVKGLMAGVPCFYGRPGFIGADASRPFGEDIEAPYRGDMTQFLRRLAWSMWTPAEIATGEPIGRLL